MQASTLTNEILLLIIGFSDPWYQVALHVIDVIVCSNETNVKML